MFASPFFIQNSQQGKSVSGLCGNFCLSFGRKSLKNYVQTPLTPNVRKQQTIWYHWYNLQQMKGFPQVLVSINWTTLWNLGILLMKTSSLRTKVKHGVLCPNFKLENVTNKQVRMGKRYEQKTRHLRRAQRVRGTGTKTGERGSWHTAGSSRPVTCRRGSFLFGEPATPRPADCSWENLQTPAPPTSTSIYSQRGVYTQKFLPALPATVTT